MRFPSRPFGRIGVCAVLFLTVLGSAPAQQAARKKANQTQKSGQTKTQEEPAYDIFDTGFYVPDLLHAYATLWEAVDEVTEEIMSASLPEAASSKGGDKKPPALPRRQVEVVIGQHLNSTPYELDMECLEAVTAEYVVAAKKHPWKSYPLQVHARRGVAGNAVVYLTAMILPAKEGEFAEEDVGAGPLFVYDWEIAQVGERLGRKSSTTNYGPKEIHARGRELLRPSDPEELVLKPKTGTGNTRSRTPAKKR